MRKMTANSMITKVIAIAVAAMIAVTAAPTTVYAEGEETPTTPTPQIAENISVCEEAVEIADSLVSEAQPVQQEEQQSGQQEEQQSGQQEEQQPQQEAQPVQQDEPAQEPVQQDEPAQEPVQQDEPVQQPVQQDEPVQQPVQQPVQPEETGLLVKAANAVNEVPGLGDLAVEVPESPVAENPETGEITVNTESPVTDENGNIVKPVTSTIDEAIETTKKEVKVVNKKVQEIQSKLENVDVAGSVNNATEEVSTFSDSVDKAVEIYNDPTKTQADLDKAKKEAKDNYDKADAAVNTAQNTLNHLKEDRDNAEKELAETETLMQEANVIADASWERMKAVQSKLRNTTAIVENKKEELDDLKKIRDQYYAVMVEYFNAKKSPYEGVAQYKKDENGELVRGEDGLPILDVEKSVESNSQKRETAIAQGVPAPLYEYSRYLTDLLVEYMIKHEEEDVAKINFGIGGTKDIMKKATVVENENGDGLSVTVTSQKDDIKRILWNKPNPSNNDYGRSNYVNVEITYNTKDENGDPIKEVRKYNYVMKQEGYDSPVDIKNGFFYLAEIDGKSVNRVKSDYNLDNYTELNKLYELVNGIENEEDAKELMEALEEVNNATKQVEALKDKLSELKNVTLLDAQKITQYESELKTAKENLKEAKVKLDKIGSKNSGSSGQNSDTNPTTPGNNGGKKTNSSTPSGTNPAGTDDGYDGGAADDGSGDAAGDNGGDVTTVATAGGQVAQGQVLGVFRPLVTNGNAKKAVKKDGKVLGANRDKIDASKGTGEEEEVEAETEEVTKKKTVQIEDEKVALAKAPVKKGFRMSWWWLLLLLLLIVILKVIYDKYKEHNEKVCKANIARIEEEQKVNKEIAGE